MSLPDVPVQVLVVGQDLLDPSGDLVRRYRLGDADAVLVRPDGHVAWRLPGRRPARPRRRRSPPPSAASPPSPSEQEGTTTMTTTLHHRSGGPRRRPRPRGPLHARQRHRDPRRRLRRAAAGAHGSRPAPAGAPRRRPRGVPVAPAARRTRRRLLPGGARLAARPGDGDPRPPRLVRRRRLRRRGARDPLPLTPDGRLVESGSAVAFPGDVAGLLPPGDIHRVHNVGDRRRSRCTCTAPTCASAAAASGGPTRTTGACVLKPGRWLLSTSPEQAQPPHSCFGLVRRRPWRSGNCSERSRSHALAILHLLMGRGAGSHDVSVPHSAAASPGLFNRAVAAGISLTSVNSWNVTAV